MGKGRKRITLERFIDMTIPLSWDDYENFLTKNICFEMDQKKGGRGRSFTKENETFTAFKSHGSRRIESNVRKDDRKKAIDALKRLGIVSEE
jgi:hypothetical protein